jgi:hypothetical protein
MQECEQTIRGEVIQSSSGALDGRSSRIAVDAFLLSLGFGLVNEHRVKGLGSWLLWAMLHCLSQSLHDQLL